MEKTVTALVKELKAMSIEVRTEADLANVASVSAGGMRVQSVGRRGSQEGAQGCTALLVPDEP